MLAELFFAGSMMIGRLEPANKPANIIENVTITYYCPCEECSCGYGRQTSTGATATAGRTIAVDPDVIPYGTHVVIDGHEYVAEDCGGMVNGNHIDIFVDTHDQTHHKYIKDVEILGDDS